MVNRHPDRTGLCWHNGSIDEDILTGEVFRAIRYVPEAASAFIDALRRLNPAFARDPSDTTRIQFAPWPGWEIPDGDLPRLFAVMQSREKAAGRTEEKGGIVPDLVIDSPSWRLLVESEESKAYDAVQLVQQYLISRLSYGDSRRTYQFLVGPSLARPGGLAGDILGIWKAHDAVIRRADSSGKVTSRDLLNHLLWIGWGEIEGVFSRLAERLSPPQSWVLLDCVAVLNRKGHAYIPPPDPALTACAANGALVETLRVSLTEAGRLPSERLALLLESKEALADFVFRVRRNMNVPG